MVSASDHLLPFVAVLLAWFASTALIVHLANRPRTTYRVSLVLTGVAAAMGLVVVAATRHDDGPMSAYLAFGGALVIWGWQEFAFLTGAAAGPRRVPADPNARGLERFRQAAAALLWHELALAGLALLLILLSVGSGNQVAASAFALLFVLRLLAKFGIFGGALNLHAELMPPQLRYLQSYFGPPQVSGALLLGLLTSLLLATWLGSRALTAEPGGEAVAATLLFALACLGALEMLFLALPVRDGALWRWALPTGRVNDLAELK